MKLHHSAVILVSGLTIAACTESPTEFPGARELRVSGDPVLVGAGDIASCASGGDEITADLLDGIAGTVFTAGDNAYEQGTGREFNRCYDPTWGRHRARTRPSPGNHDYLAPGADGYFDYFDTRAGPSRRGYYSYDLGAWHVISLNSNIPAGAASNQAEWLRDDLAVNPNVCTLAYWHHPVFSSGEHGSLSKMKAIWGILDGAEVDVVVQGHDHDYERFAPQDADGNARTDGIRSFVVGTGGESLRPFDQVRRNSVVRNSQSLGVLKLTLHATSYSWKFIPEPGENFSDAGNADCITVGARPRD